MLLSLVPEAVARNWHEISKHVVKSIPASELDGEVLNNVLEGILAGQITCWVSYDDQNDKKPNAILLTTSIYDPFKNEKNLLLYAITRTEELDNETLSRMYQEGVEAFVKYLRANGFSRFVGYIDESNSYLVNTIKSFGAKVQWHWSLSVVED